MEIDNISTLLDTGAAQADIRMTSDEGIPFVVIPDDHQIANLEHLLEIPTRKRGNVVTTDTHSFIGYVQKHGIKDFTVIYADIDADASRFYLVAIIDDHGTDGPHWREHRCHFSPKQSLEWTRWLKNNRNPMSQSDFATWLEDNLPDIANVEGMPTGTEILQMALALSLIHI